MRKDTLKRITVSARKKSGIDELKTREKRFIAAGLMFVVGFLVFQIAVLPFVEARGNLVRSLKKKESELVDIQLLRQEYVELKSKQGDIEKRLAKRVEGFSLFSFLEEQATQVKVKDRVTYMKPSNNEIDERLSESVVEMKIEKVSLKQVVDFLLKIESDDQVVLVQRISIQESSQDSGILDTVLRIMTYELNKI